MSLSIDPRPFYGTTFTAPTDQPSPGAGDDIPGVALSVPSNTNTIIILNNEPPGGRSLQLAILDTFQLGIPNASLPFIDANPITFNQQIGITTLPPGTSLDMDIGPEGERASLFYPTYTATGSITITAAITAGDSFSFDTTPSTGPFLLTSVAGAVGVDQFQVATTTTLNAQRIAAAINDVANSFLTFVTATALNGVVTLSAVAADAAGNGVIVTSAGPSWSITAVGPAGNLMSPQDNRYVLLFQGINGTVSTTVTLKQGRGYTGP